MKHLLTFCLVLLTISFSYAQRGGQYHRSGHSHSGYHNHGAYHNHGGGYTYRHGANVNIRINGGGGARCNRGAQRPSCGWRTWTPCCANDFNFVMHRINAQCFESDRVRVARRLIASYHFSTYQLHRILGLFTFECNRLDVAKFAYHYTCDRANYPYLYNCFSFRSSIRDLDNYIHCH